MTPEREFELGVEIGSLINLARMIDVEDLRDIIARAERFDTFATITDPTLWLRENVKVTYLVAAARIVLDFREAIMRLDAAKQ